MLKSIFRDLVISVKVYYANILLVCIPFFAVVALVSIPIYYNFAVLKHNRLITLGVPLLNSTMFGMACVAGLYFVKELNGGENSFKKLIGQLKADLFSIAKVVIKKVILIQLGLLFLFIPGIFFFIRWYLVYPIFVFEKSGNPFDRSMDLTKKSWGFIFILFLLFFSLMMIGIIFGGLVRLLYLEFNAEATGEFSRVLLAVVSILFFLFITPLIILFDFHFYRYCLDKYKKDIPLLKEIGK